MKNVLLGTAVLLGACVVLSVVASIANRFSDPTTTPTAIIQAAAPTRPAPSPTVAPTLTAVPPTATLAPPPTATTVPTVAPTAVPKPAATIAPKPEPAKPTGMSEAAYRSFIVRHTTDMGRSIATFSDLMETPRFLNADWRRGVATELGRWRASYTSAQEVAPPDRFRDAHLSYLAALAKFNAASFDIAYGLDNPTTKDGAARIDKARVELIEARALMEQATRQMPRD